jgi:hydrogenase maturation protease
MDLVIGMGNPWRGDDGIGHAVVESVESRPQVKTMAVQQLVPELAEWIRSADRVLFVDASIEAEELTLQRVRPSLHRGLGHACSPGAVLEWTALAYGARPEAWLLQIPAASFGPGAGLSPQLARRVPESAAAVNAWLDRGLHAADSRSSEEEA